MRADNIESTIDNAMQSIKLSTFDEIKEELESFSSTSSYDSCVTENKKKVSINQKDSGSTKGLRKEKKKDSFVRRQNSMDLRIGKIDKYPKSPYLPGMRKELVKEVQVSIKPFEGQPQKQEKGVYQSNCLDREIREPIGYYTRTKKRENGKRKISLNLQTKNWGSQIYKRSVSKADLIRANNLSSSKINSLRILAGKKRRSLVDKFLTNTNSVNKFTQRSSLKEPRTLERFSIKRQV